MEVLKASDYTILATCGGMALCATCHVQVLEGLDQLPPAQDAELDMLDTLPDADFGQPTVVSAPRGRNIAGRCVSDSGGRTVNRLTV